MADTEGVRMVNARNNDEYVCDATKAYDRKKYEKRKMLFEEVERRNCENSDVL